MDELVIGEKKYISSKRAAELTGYAKDYVGQLCREGRVEARLVGRSWYVLESSITEHRFGRQEEALENTEPEAQEQQETSTWESPKYAVETAAPLPELIERPRSFPVSSTINLLAVKPQNSAADMASKQADELATAAPSKASTIIEPEAEEAQEQEETNVTLHKVRPSPHHGGHEMDVVVKRAAPKSAQKAEIRTPAPQGGSFLGLSLTIAAALISVSIMLIGTGVIDRYLLPAAAESGFIKFLGGKSFYYK